MESQKYGRNGSIATVETHTETIEDCVREEKSGINVDKLVFHDPYSTMIEICIFYHCNIQKPTASDSTSDVNGAEDTVTHPISCVRNLLFSLVLEVLHSNNSIKQVKHDKNTKLKAENSHNTKAFQA
ncbi:unnamed protein product [Sphenostylis stenocarpa]|uniref:Uncharacterized protein n=1 Tax=Sphenostylis stenocarpa TaxID=92480 RepID=A0AA86TB28_9FABA|nr:unnamed protein product [Sphenostylis stenocarpa]